MILLTVDQSMTDLAKTEIARLCPGKRIFNLETYVCVDTETVPFARLALTKSAYRMIASCKLNDLHTAISSIDWTTHISPPYRFTNFVPQISSREVTNMIWHTQKKPAVNLHDFKTEIVLLPIGKEVALAITVHENTENFTGRRAHLRPQLHPSSLHPKLARALVNLAATDEICDPFCGSGGILIEAALLGLKVIGSDIDAEQVNRAITNLAAANLEKVQVTQLNALTLTGHMSAIVTDFPYGKNPKRSGVTELYRQFLAHATTLTNTIVCMAPQPLETLLEGLPWQVAFSTRQYVHRSLTRHIYLLLTPAKTNS